MPDDGELLRTAYEARDRQLAELRAELADLMAQAELARADAVSHAREADAQRARAERAERGAAELLARIRAQDAELRRPLVRLARRLPGR